MNISGLVLTLDPNASPKSLDTLHADARVTVGQAIGARLPIVIEAENERVSRDLVEHLTALEGVLAVDIAFVSFGEPMHRS